MPATSPISNPARQHLAGILPDPTPAGQRFAGTLPDPDPVDQHKGPK